MTQAFNLSQLANKVNSSGLLDVATGVTGTQPVVNGGTGQSTYTDGQLLIGNTTGNTLTKTTLTAGTGISVTNGSGAITIASTGGGGFSNMQVFTSPGTWTNPGSVTKVKVTVVGGGGNGGDTPGGNPSGNYTSTGGAGGGTALGIKTIPTSPVSVTVGGATGTSSFGPYISATGGSSGSTRLGAGSINTSAGVGSGGDLNLRGGIGSSSGPGFACGGGANITGEGFGQHFAGGNTSGQPAQSASYGAAGSGSSNLTGGGDYRAGGAGQPGVVIVEW
jgi:hypothetical protein